MNLKWTVLLLPAVLALTGCQDEVLDFRNAQLSNGLFYSGVENKPFSGTLTNLPFKTLHPSSAALNPALDVVPGRVGAILSALKASDEETYLQREICSVGVKEGLLNGEMKCSEPQTAAIRYTFNFTAGQPDGAIKAYDKTGNKVLGEGHASKGLLDGDVAVYSPSHGKKLYTANYKNGLQEGKEEVFADSTGKLVSQMTYLHGKLEGEVTQYTANGTLIGKLNFLNGQQDGVQEQYDPKSGRTLVQATWNNGDMDGPMKKWDEAGNLVESGHYKRNSWYPDPKPGTTVTLGNTSLPVSDVDACVSSWVDAFRKENGEDAAVMNDQLEEWQGWCESGKTP